jgi:hypothetical protein
MIKCYLYMCQIMEEVTKQNGFGLVQLEQINKYYAR